MKKQDLKTGMQVEFSDGSRFVVMLDTLKGDVVCEIDGQSWAYLKDYTDDFVCDNDHFPVKAVYGNHFPNEFIFLKMDEEDLLWQREEK